MEAPRILSSVVLALVLFVPSCSAGTETPSNSSPPSATAPADPLAGTAWTLDTITHPSGNAPVPEQERPTIAFAEGRVSGSAGCNTYSGSYSVDGSSLELGTLAATSMACVGDAAVIEVAYMGPLAKVDSFSVRGDTLTLSGGGSSLVYSAAT
jgi:heat shock protein HslJ